MITNLAMWVSRTALGLLRKYGMWTTLVPLGLGMDGGGCAGGGGGGVSRVKVVVKEVKLSQELIIFEFVKMNQNSIDMV